MVGGRIMAFADKKGIVVASPFKLQAESMLDVRQQVDTIEERDELVTIKAATAGLRVFVKATKKSYVYNGTSWDELSIGSASLVVKLNGGTSEGTNMFTYNGTSAKTINITPSSIGAAASSHTHTKSQITDFPTSMKNPNALKFAGAVTGSYDGSSAVTITIPNTANTAKSLIVTLNGGTTEGTDKFTFNGSAEKSINITPSTIGAAAATHTHNVSNITGLTTGRAMVSDANGHPSVSSVTATELSYLDGVTSSVQTQLNNKAALNHTHNYAGSSSAGGSANSAVKLATARKINGTSFDGTKDINILNNYFDQIDSETDLNNLKTYGEYYAAGGSGCKNVPSGVGHFYLKVFRSASGYTAQTLYEDTKYFTRFYNGTSWSSWAELYSTANKPTASEIGAAASSHTHTASQITGLPTSLKNPYAITFAGAVTGSYDGSSAVTITIPTSASTKGSLVVKLNGGTTEGTNQFTFNGASDKTINITPSGIGAAASSHSHGLATTSANGFLRQLDGSTAHFMRGDGTWATPPNTTYSAFKGATADAAGGTGLVPAPASGAQSKFLRADGTWQTPTNTTYSNFKAATSSAAGGAGLVPAPAAGAQSKFLRGDATWQSITPSSIGAAASSHTHTSSQISDFDDAVADLLPSIPTKLPNPYSITFTGATTGTYDGSKAVTINIPTTGATSKESLVIKLNSGTTEGTNMFTFNGGTAKTVNITPSSIGAAAASHGTHVTYGTDAPRANGTASAGSASSVSRSDHVHPLQTTISGNAGSATKLATPRTVDGVSFNGTANITHYGTCSTAAATAAKTVSLTGFTLATGAIVTVKFTVTNTAASPTLNVNGTGAKAIQYRGAAISAGYLAANRVYTFIYDGTNYQLIGDINTDTNTTYSTGTATTAGITKLYTGTGSATDGTMTQKAITDALGGKASSSHTHNYAGSSSAGGAATSANKVNSNLVVKLNGGSTEGTNMFTFNGSTAKTINITASGIGAAASSHTHGVASTSANGFLKQLDGSTSHFMRGDGTWATPPNTTYSTFKAATADAAGGTGLVPAPAAGAQPKFLRADGTWQTPANTTYSNFKAATSSAAGGSGLVPAPAAGAQSKFLRGDATWQTISLSTFGITATAAELNYMDGVKSNVQTQLNGKASSSHTHNYAGSSSAGGAATSAAKVNNNLVVKLNSGTTEGTNMFTFNGSAAKTVNITPSAIGAAASSHTHNYAGSSSAGGAANSVKSALTIQFNGSTKATFNGSAAATINITPSAIGAAASSHTHNYAGSSSAGGAANSAKKVPVPVGTVLFATSSSTSFFNSCFGGTWEIVGNIDAIVGNGTSLTLYMFRKTAA